MSDVQVLMATVGENLGALLHGSVAESEGALDRVLTVVDDGPSFGALCGMLAEIGGDALRETRAQMPPGPARTAEFGMFPMSESVPQHERVSRQLITASANGDAVLVKSLLVAVLSWPFESMAMLVGYLAAVARALHLSVCSDPTSDVEKGAGA